MASCITHLPTLKIAILPLEGVPPTSFDCKVRRINANHQIFPNPFYFAITIMLIINK